MELRLMTSPLPTDFSRDELDAIEIVTLVGEEHKAGEQLQVRVTQSHSSTMPAKKTRMKLCTCVESIPSLEALSLSSFSQELSCDESLSEAPKKADDTIPPSDAGCVTDRFVRLLCPFQVDESVQNSRHPFGASNMIKASRACIPRKWEGSPERVTRKRNIRNRKSATHAATLVKQWHSPVEPIPFKASRTTVSHRKVAPPPSESSVFYDSEPEVASTPRYKKHRPKPLVLDDASDCPREPVPVQRHSSQNLHFFNSPRSVIDMPDLLNDDDDETRDYIKAGMDHIYKLVWHQAPSLAKSSGASQMSQPAPLAVTGWYEYGSTLSSSVVFPKFVFRPTVGEIQREPNSIQLLTITSVLKPNTIDRATYPFARLDRSCCIVTHEGTRFVFEAACSQSRDLFVDRMKVIVARLASSVIVHDESMLQEFFLPSGAESFADFNEVDGATEECTPCSSDKLLLYSH
ncbi:expressed unknown protein [Seminavis robusta]|uniref:Uncharacterized protein n=1 Tax=Seminavis robusta TaxID=568900 RepID=A0A9N8DBQ9_9STRA|nr:expressed unknown protein [Seminavis robusta]|eukprot:Sro26_g017490.1 n/a (461) ;mRNA; r:36943-38422